jgi:hypothetical protein
VITIETKTINISEELKRWAKHSMDFVYNDLGYTKEQILHTTIHLDEKTPHMHVVVIPLVKKFDTRSKEDRYSITKKHYIKDKFHLSDLQDVYHARMTNNGFNLERGIKGSDNEHINIKEYKRMTNKLNNSLDSKTKRLNKAMNELDDKMLSNKEILFDKEYIKIKKETFNSMSKVIKETKKVAELQPMIQQVYNDVDNFAQSYKAIETEKKNIQAEVRLLEIRNRKLEKENKDLKDYIKAILGAIKTFFRNMLKFGNEETKDMSTLEIKDFYDNRDFNNQDIYDIAVDTSKEEDLFDYADIDLRHESYPKDKDDFDISI